MDKDLKLWPNSFFRITDNSAVLGVFAAGAEGGPGGSRKTYPGGVGVKVISPGLERAVLLFFTRDQAAEISQHIDDILFSQREEGDDG